MNNILQSIPEEFKHVIDMLSVTALLGVLMDVLPVLSSLLTIVWLSIRISETRTVRGWLKLRNQIKDE